jgi:hypothetical protein
MNTSISNVTARQLRKAADIKERIENLQRELDEVLGGSGADNYSEESTVGTVPKRRGMSAAGRAAISAAATARWAAIRGTAPAGAANAPRRKMSAQGLANIRAGVRKRMAQQNRAAAVNNFPRRTMSPAAKAKLSAIAKARWKKARAQGKGTL